MKVFQQDSLQMWQICNRKSSSVPKAIKIRQNTANDIKCDAFFLNSRDIIIIGEIHLVTFSVKKLY